MPNIGKDTIELAIINLANLKLDYRRIGIAIKIDDGRI
ncbi:hypothetical protein Cha6605_3820 [Chamaesiphon minutus PCC 6605]|uniref:Uncharacterized protein n=2 Tax=Chamaesiphon TaxID=217161 RepID=K9UK45_CHAP6|nr:hypothetical protein Cha6605_3820 [Chamaesiphon minutus PCC 6605]